MGKTGDVGGVQSSGANQSALGVMPSMSAACTPLKHRYDACFNRWFEDYLGLNDKKASSSSSSSSRSSLWSSASSSSGKASDDALIEASLAPGGPQRSAAERRSLKDRLEGECGQMWKEYRTCVLRAVKDRDLEELIDEARGYNPFPFPKDVPKDRANNEPFPFPAANR